MKKHPKAFPVATKNYDHLYFFFFISAAQKYTTSDQDAVIHNTPPIKQEHLAGDIQPDGSESESESPESTGR